MLRAIILSRSDALLESCLQSMEKSQPGSSAYVVVGDNGLSEDFRKKWNLVSYVRVAAFPDFVFEKAFNQCVRNIGTEDDIVAINDDVEICPHSPLWYDRCQELLRNWPAEFGLMRLTNDGELPAGTIFPAINSIVGSFLDAVIPRRIWDLIGPMDERFLGYGWGDVDWCLRVLHAGYLLGITNQVLFTHIGTASYNSVPRDRLRSWGENFKLYGEKWNTQEMSLTWPISAPHFRRVGCSCSKADIK